MISEQSVTKKLDQYTIYLLISGMSYQAEVDNNRLVGKDTHHDKEPVGCNQVSDQSGK